MQRDCWCRSTQTHTQCVPLSSLADQRLLLNTRLMLVMTPPQQTANSAASPATSSLQLVHSLVDNITHSAAAHQLHWHHLPTTKIHTVRNNCLTDVIPPVKPEQQWWMNLPETVHIRTHTTASHLTHTCTHRDLFRMSDTISNNSFTLVNAIKTIINNCANWLWLIPIQWTLSSYITQSTTSVNSCVCNNLLQILLQYLKHKQLYFTCHYISANDTERRYTQEPQTSNWNIITLFYTKTV